MHTVTSTDTIFIPGAPEIPGLVFRGFQGASDFPEMVAVIQGSKEVDRLERANTAEDIERHYKHLVNCDPYQDMLFAEVDGQVIGYSRVEWRNEISGRFVYVHFGFLLPDWRRKGIGRTMLRYNQRRLREIAADQPGMAERVYESFASSTEKAATALLLDEGYQAERHFYEMVRPDLEDIPNAPMPLGLEVRPVRPEHYQAIYEASKEAFRDHWGFSEKFEPGVDQWLDDPDFDPSLWRVAWDGEQVAGMVRSFIDRKQNEEYNRKRGWTEDICVRRPWRRRGLARSLIVQSFHALKERGMQEAALGVDTENHNQALHLYESVGFRPVRRTTVYHKPF
jgi:ribosomal protein S18 acetylase RimI-like enzyme